MATALSAHRNYAGSVKRQSRNEIAKAWRCKHRKPASVYVCLPSADCNCVKQFLRMGIINRDTYIIYAERVPHLRDIVIPRTLMNLGFAAFEGSTHLEEVVIDQPVDLAWIDACGELLNSSVRKWIANELTPHLTDNAVCAFTTQAHARHKPYWRRCVQYRKRGEAMMQRMRVCTLQGYEHTKYDVLPAVAAQLQRLTQRTPHTQIRYRDGKPHMGITIV